MWRETTKHERNLEIWQAELEEFVPNRVLDFHVHVFNEGTVPEGETFSSAGHAIRHYDFGDLRQDLAEAFPVRDTFAVCFGLPHTQYDKSENDRYVASGCDGKRFFGLRLLDPAEDPDEVGRDLVDQRFFGVKPYLDYVRKDDPESVEIDDMLPAGLMRVVDELGMIVMLHIPRKGRLADALNQEQLARLCRTYPRARIVLAHVGRAYFFKNIVGHLDRLRDLPNLYYDLAMVMNVRVLEYLFQQVPHERILFASDAPIALAPGCSVEINNQYTYVTPVPWELSISDDHQKLVFTSFLYEQLRAIKTAVQRLGMPRRFVQGLFYGHGMRLLDAVR